MVRSMIIFAFFALATVLVIVLQPGPRPQYAYEAREQMQHETTRNEVQVLPEPQNTQVLSAPNDVIAKLKAAAQPKPPAATETGTTASLKRLQAALDASLGEAGTVSDARPGPVAAIDVPQDPAPQAPMYYASSSQAIAPELRDMSWQTLNTLNGLAQVSRAPGQEGSLLNSIVRRSMGHVDGTQILRTDPIVTRTSAVANVPARPASNSQRPTKATARSYIVSSGDTLALIAIKLYGSALATDRLLSENPALRQNPNALRIGQVLKYSTQ